MKYRIIKRWDTGRYCWVYVLQKKRRWLPGWTTLSWSKSLNLLEGEYDSLMKAEQGDKVVWSSDEPAPAHNPVNQTDEE